MKYLLILCLVCSIPYAQTADITPADWSGSQDYGNDGNNGWAYGKKPVVPEPAAYGAIMLGALLAYQFVKRNRNKK